MNTLFFLKEIFIVTITSFGGQSGHLLAFIKRFTVINNWYKKEEILDLHAFCSLLPGATSTQLLCLIAYKKGGFRLCLLSLLIWITPLSILMFSISLLLYEYNLIFDSDRLFAFFQPMILVFMLMAGIKIKNRYDNSINNNTLLLISTIIFLIFFKHPFIIPIVFLLSGIYTHLKSSNNLSGLFTIRLHDFKLNKKLLTLLLSIFFFTAFTSEYSRKFETKNRYIFNLMEHNIRHGSIIYGGGDVLVPMMYEQYITRPTAKIIKKRNPDVLTLKKSELMAGAGIIRLMPGPVFSLVSFTAPLMLNEYNLPKKTLATLLATLSIYLPGILIILILFPIWEKVTLSFTHMDFLKGIYLSVSSLIFASCLYLTFDLFRNSVDYSLLICQLIMGTSIFVALSKYHINHAFIAILCLSVGILFHYL